jgi:hypothetical protein
VSEQSEKKKDDFITVLLWWWWLSLQWLQQLHQFQILIRHFLADLLKQCKDIELLWPVGGGCAWFIW